MIKSLFSLLLLLAFSTLNAQSFYFGADQSYVNEMEDCGVVYKENGEAKDVYQIYQDYGNNLVRLRLWHTPKWYDNLNSGRRYSDLNDVKKAIRRAKDHDMNVLLDFHLSDNWADPGKQLVPEAWLPVVDNLPLLKDSLYNYIQNTLEELENEDLLPEMVQIGNETNKGILLSPEDNAVWTLDWDRNAALFNEGIRAVRDFNQDIQIMIHAAGPDNSIWLMEQFHTNGVIDFDVIGISYYWAWHKPITIEETGNIVQNLVNKYNKQVIIAETGYIWTTSGNDSANNIISEIDSKYGAASPESQKQWLIDLTTEIIQSGGTGVIYWEPSWVSSSCSTQWGQGSHQEHATFFDFNTNLLIPGGIQWMNHDYGLPSIVKEIKIDNHQIEIKYSPETKSISIKLDEDFSKMTYSVIDSAGRVLDSGILQEQETEIQIGDLLSQIIFVSLTSEGNLIKTEKVAIVK